MTLAGLTAGGDPGGEAIALLKCLRSFVATKYGEGGVRNEFWWLSLCCVMRCDGGSLSLNGLLLGMF